MFKTIIRNLRLFTRRDRGYIFINIIGLAIGLTCSILILLYVFDEFSYDGFNSKADRIYRIAVDGGISEQQYEAAVSPFIAGPALKRDFPEIEEYCRLYKPFSETVMRIDNKEPFYAKDILWGDNSVFKLFDFSIVQGDNRTPLSAPNQIVISQKAANKYFRGENPIGKVLKIGAQEDEYTITAVISNIPHNSHFSFNFLASVSTFKLDETDPGKWFSDIDYYTYLLFKNDIDLNATEKKINNYTFKLLKPLAAKFGITLSRDGSTGAYWNFVLQPLRSIYLHSNLGLEFKDLELGEIGSLSTVYILIAICILILIIASINFMNLSTAISVNRANEIGIRKAVGASKREIVNQLLGESYLQTFTAFLIAAVLSELLLPFFNNLTSKNLNTISILNPVFMIVIIMLLAVVGFLSGSYPAFYLSSRKPVEILKGAIRSGRSGNYFRKTLIILQFVISVVLIVSTLTMSKQLRYMKNRMSGFNEDQQVVIKLNGKKNRTSYERYINEILKNGSIKSATGSSDVPGSGYVVNPYFIGENNDKKQKMLNQIRVDYNYLKTYDIKLIRGRNFSREMTTDPEKAVLINEAALKYFNWKDGIGGKIIAFNQDLSTRDLYVIGIVKDFNYESLRSRIKPLIIRMVDVSYGAFYVTIHIDTENISQTLDFIKAKFKDTFPGLPFEYYFLESNFDSYYKDEQRLNKVVGILTGLSIIIACLGLFGLAAFTAERRTKEIGIRKAIGAYTGNIVKMLIVDFCKLVAIGSLIACPLAYILTKHWLGNFAYRIDPGLGDFVLAIFVILFASISAVIYQTIRSATTNPIKALRYE